VAQNKIALDYMGLYLPVKLNITSQETGSGIYFLGAVYADYSFNGVSVAEDGTVEKLNFVSQKSRYDGGIRGSIGLMATSVMGIEIGYNKGLHDIEFYTSQGGSNPNYLINNKGFTIALVALF
jgi:hypothetical protein